MPRIALVTARAARGLDDDIPLLEAALRRIEADFLTVDWDDASVDWSQFQIAVLRSTWDYATRFAEFLTWADRVAKLTTLINPPSVVRWNVDKHYLLDLSNAGIPVIPSEFIEPGSPAEQALAAFLTRHHPKEFVVKPAVGAGSRDVFRFGSEEGRAAAAHAQKLLNENRSVLLQPYLERVDAEGETALLYFDGEFSHAIRKGPMLQREQREVQGLFKAERITPRRAGDDELSLGSQVRAAIPFRGLLYARIDMIRDSSGEPRVLELELTEPSVFLDHHPEAADRFAQRIRARTLPFSDRHSS